jgi:hypothetical protein
LESIIVVLTPECNHRGVKYDIIYFVVRGLLALLKTGLQILEATLGARIVINKCTMALSSMTLPAWCAAASGTGTRYSNVVIPKAT